MEDAADHLVHDVLFPVPVRQWVLSFPRRLRFLAAREPRFASRLPGGSRPPRRAIWNALLSIPARIGGLILVLLGSAALALGAWDLLSPDAFDRWVRSFR